MQVEKKLRAEEQNIIIQGNGGWEGKSQSLLSSRDKRKGEFLGYLNKKSLVSTSAGSRPRHIDLYTNLSLARLLTVCSCVCKCWTRVRQTFFARIK